MELIIRLFSSQSLGSRSQDGTSKMSKSAENDLSRINLTDDADAIRNKVIVCA